MAVLGLTDPWIWGAYVACIVCTVFCCVYGYLNGRKDSEEEEEDD